MFTHDSYEDWRGIDVVDAAGDPIGEVVEVMLDTDTGLVEWIAVDVRGDRPASPESGDVSSPVGVRLIPMSGVSFGEDALVSRWTVDHVAAAPGDGAADGISRRDEDRIYRHYGLDYPTHWVNDGMPGGAESVGLAGIAAEGHRSSGAPSRSRTGPAADHEVDEPRRVATAGVVRPPTPDDEARLEDERRATLDGIGDGAG
ncbi:MAG: PRC-barrel domain-containing protein [Actinomycetota bacterium]|nr:PRC-barrel domain-containing protein [Actinomycetota bacterium]